LINIWSAVETTEGGTWTKVFTSNHWLWHDIDSLSRLPFGIIE
jgi:hypothetical protein